MGSSQAFGLLLRRSIGFLLFGHDRTPRIMAIAKDRSIMWKVQGSRDGALKPVQGDHEMGENKDEQDDDTGDEDRWRGSGKESKRTMSASNHTGSFDMLTGKGLGIGLQNPSVGLVQSRTGPKAQICKDSVRDIEPSMVHPAEQPASLINVGLSARDVLPSLTHHFPSSSPPSAPGLRSNTLSTMPHSLASSALMKKSLSITFSISSNSFLTGKCL